jgi:hypothetical protein
VLPDPLLDHVSDLLVVFLDGLRMTIAIDADVRKENARGVAT